MEKDMLLCITLSTLFFNYCTEQFEGSIALGSERYRCVLQSEAVVCKNIRRENKCQHEERCCQLED